MGYKRDYLKDTARRAFEAWGWAERLVALTLVAVSAIAYIGLLFKWWETDNAVVLIGAGASIGLFAWALILFLFVTPARFWRDARPGPFALNIGACRIERMPRQWQHELIAATHVVRLPVQNLGPTGRFRAYLSSHQGIAEAQARVPLAWEGEAEAEIELLTVTPEWKEENTARVKVGYLGTAVKRRDGKLFEFSPAYPGFPQTASHLADVILPNDDGDLPLRLRIGNRDNQWESVEITLRMTDDGPTCVMTPARDIREPPIHTDE